MAEKSEQKSCYEVIKKPRIYIVNFCTKNVIKIMLFYVKKKH